MRKERKEERHNGDGEKIAKASTPVQCIQELIRNEFHAFHLSPLQPFLIFTGRHILFSITSELRQNFLDTLILFAPALTYKVSQAESVIGGNFLL